MAEMLLTLKRTVFLPKGSPGICTVREIKADISSHEITAEGGRIYCLGEVDLLIEYLSFAEGSQYPGYEAYEQRLKGGGVMWQALLTLPFELQEEGEIVCPPLAELTVGQLNWFMVAPHALEMEMGLTLSWQDEGIPCQEQGSSPAPGPDKTAWRKITLEEQAEAEKAKSKVILRGESSNMEKEEKIIHVGQADKNWLQGEADEKMRTEVGFAEKKIITAETVEKEPLLKQVEIMEQKEEEGLAAQAAGLAVEPQEGEPASGPMVLMQSVETPYQLLPDMASELLAGMVAESAAAPPVSGRRRRVAGLPRFHTVLAEQTPAFSGYKVSYYRVRTGDTIPSIAAALHVSEAALIDKNSLQGRELQQGMVLMIPA